MTSTTAPVQDVDAVVGVPDGDGPFPAVVLVHGGGWVTGGPAILAPLATHLEENGYLTVNTRYTLATFERGAFPDAVDDVACAVRYAANHPDGDGTVAIVGHSAGAHIGALVALTGDAYGADCQFPGSGLPERFVGLAGPYDVSRLEFAVAAFFGGGPEQFTDAWAAGNPQLLTDQNVDLRSLILYGERDGIVPEGFSLDFYEALIRTGSDSLLELVEGARHNQMHDPDLVGDLILTWLDR
jgi:acetyl esterase/lipase